MEEKKEDSVYDTEKTPKSYRYEAFIICIYQLRQSRVPRVHAADTNSPQTTTWKFIDKQALTRQGPNHPVPPKRPTSTYPNFLPPDPLKTTGWSTTTGTSPPRRRSRTLEALLFTDAETKQPEERLIKKASPFNSRFDFFRNPKFLEPYLSVRK